MSSGPSRRRDRHQSVREWWPEVARYSGLALGAYGVLLAPSPDKATVLGFAATLVLTPVVLGAQRRRNGRREQAEGDE